NIHQHAPSHRFSLLYQANRAVYVRPATCTETDEWCVLLNVASRSKGFLTIFGQDIGCQVTPIERLIPRPWFTVPYADAPSNLLEVTSGDNVILQVEAER